MAIHYQAFREELYIEHLEEAAFQYETRTNWLRDKEIGWQEVQQVDTALEAHLDALMVGETLAVKVCLNALEDADPSTLHVIVRILCRHKLIDRLNKLWSDFDFEDQEKVNAVADALKWECPVDWLPEFVKVYSSGKTELFPVFAQAIAHKGRDNAELLLSAVPKLDDEAKKTVIEASRLCDKKNKQNYSAALTSICSTEKTDDLQEALITSLVYGHIKPLVANQALLEKLPLAFALAGNASHAKMLTATAQKGTASEDALFALGLLGSLESVPSLLGYLKHPDYAPTAALALNLITGASLYEDVHTPDDVEEAELFEHELEAYAKGELPKNIDGVPYGGEVHQLTLNPALWQQWLEQNKQNFQTGQRYRNGKLYSPRELLSNLVNNQTPFRIREFAHYELMARYGLDVVFVPDELIHTQQRQLNLLHQMLQSGGFPPDGTWCFQGKVI